MNDSLLSPSPYDQNPTLNHKRLARRRNGAVARLLRGSFEVLKAWQLELEFPPAIEEYLDQRLSESLRDRYAEPVDIDGVFIDFQTEHNPAVQINGDEYHQVRLSLRQLNRTLVDPGAFLALKSCADHDQRLLAQPVGLTVGAVFSLLMQGDWTRDYEAQLREFWSRHGRTWQLLARLSFLDGVHRLKSRNRITHEGYLLALDALGLNEFPQSLEALARTASPRRSSISSIVLNDEVIPGIFHLRCDATGHCFIHVPGLKPLCIEYISDHASWREEKVLEALNASPWHRLHLQLDHAANVLELGSPQENVFAELSNVQQRFSLDRLQSPNALEYLDITAQAGDEVVLAPIKPALALISVMDHWHDAGRVKARVPTPHLTASAIMGKWLKTQGIEADPKHVFIRYLRGTSRRPWANAPAAGAHLIVVPDEQPVALDQALIRNYREQHPVGYEDHGARYVVFLDTSAKGLWSEKAQLPITATQVAAYIDSVALLDVMQLRLKRFWARHATTIERSLRSTFIAQAVFSLKNGDLPISAFNLLIQAMEPTGKSSALRWSALGFHVQGDSVMSTACCTCVGLLLLTDDKTGSCILYQAGQHQPFVVLKHRDELARHLAASAADEHWRETVLSYMPAQLHPRIGYLLELWAGIKPQPTPVSYLRPWTDKLYNEEAHKAANHQFCEQDVSGCPIAFLLAGLRQNSLVNAGNAIVTDQELAIADWTRHINRLHLLLAPLAMLVPAATIATLAASAGSVALAAQAASLPGNRDAERRQLMIAILSLGLLQIGPATPRLSGLFKSMSAAPSRALSIAQRLPSARTFGAFLQRATHARRTHLNYFFNGAGPLKNWAVADSAMGSSPVRIWKLGRKFMLWTAQRKQARTLVVSSHGYYLPWSRTTAVPTGTELRAYAPHNHELIDPGLHRVVSQQVSHFAAINGIEPTIGPGVHPITSMLARDTLTAGTMLPGRIKNYTLAKFQSEQYESYRQITKIVGHSHRSAVMGDLPATPMDVLTVRNRFGMRNPTLQDLFAELGRHSIHYDRILLVHCRCSAIHSLLGRAPAFKAAATVVTGASPITP